MLFFSSCLIPLGFKIDLLIMDYFYTTLLGFPVSIFGSHCLYYSNQSVSLLFYFFLSLCMLWWLVSPSVCYSLTKEVTIKTSAGSFLDYPGNVGLGCPHCPYFKMWLAVLARTWWDREVDKGGIGGTESILKHRVKFGKISPGRERQPCCSDQLGR